MSEERLSRFQDVLQEFEDLAAGKPVNMVVHYIPTPDVKSIRARMGMNQLEFSRAFGISVGTLRNWEQGRRNPQGPAYVLLQVMDKEPEAVKRALAAAREDFKKHKVERLTGNLETLREAVTKAEKEHATEQEAARRTERPRLAPKAKAELYP